MSNLPAVRNPSILTTGSVDLFKLGQVVQQSGMFKDIRHASQAVVKLAVGQELGLGMIASLSGLHVVEGKIMLGAHVIAGKIRQSDDYDYEITEHSDGACEVAFTYHGNLAGKSRYTIEDAKRAGLIKPKGNWETVPKNMCYARAMSNGARWYCPDVFLAPVYTPDEIGYDVNDQGEIIDVPDVTPNARATTPLGQPEPDPGDRVSEAQVVRAGQLRADLAAVMDTDPAVWIRETCAAEFNGAVATDLNGTQMAAMIVLMEQYVAQLTAPPGSDEPPVDAVTDAGVVQEFVYDSESEAGVRHTVTVDADGFYTCTCKGFEFSKTAPKDCKHIMWTLAALAAAGEPHVPEGTSDGAAASGTEAAEGDHPATPGDSASPDQPGSAPLAAPAEDAPSPNDALAVQAGLVEFAGSIGLGPEAVMNAIISVVGDDFESITNPDKRATIEAGLTLAAKLAAAQAKTRASV